MPKVSKKAKKREQGRKRIANFRQKRKDADVDVKGDDEQEVAQCLKKTRPRQKRYDDKKSSERKQKQIDNRPLFDTEWDDFPEKPSFTDFTTNPETAIMMYRCNQGFPRFRFADRVDDDNPLIAKKAIEETCKEIHAEKLTPEMQEDLISRFYEMIGRSSDGDANITTCSCCGIRDVERDGVYFNTMRNAEELHVFRLNEMETEEYLHLKSQGPVEIPVDMEGTMKEVPVYRAWNVYEYKDRLLWLYEDFVEVEEDGSLTIRVCQKCHKSLGKEEPELPEHSLKNVNFGNAAALGLETPTVMERMICSDVRHHYCVKKITANFKVRSDHRHSKICAHSILFGHGTADVTQSLFEAIDRVEKVVTCHFIGPRNTIDSLMQATVGTSIVTARWYVIYQQIAIANVLNKYKKKRALPDIDDLRKRLDLMSANIVKDSMVTEDETLSARERAIGDDVAKVRNVNDDEEIEIDNSGEPNNNNEFEQSSEEQKEQLHPEGFTYVTDRAARKPISRNENGDVRNMKEIAEIFEIETPKQSEMPSCERTNEKMNEFEEGDKCLTFAFPDVFMLGKAYNREKGSLTKNQRIHLMKHHTKVASRNHDLLAYIFDQFIRHDKLQRISHYAKGNPTKLKALQEMKNSEEFAKQLKEAMKNPKSRAAKEISKRVNDVLCSVNRNSYIGAMERVDSIPKMRALSRYAGAGYCFFTFAPVDVNNPTTMRMVVRSGNNTEFPAVDDNTFIKKLEELSNFHGQTNLDIPFSYAQRMNDVVNDPIASVMEYQTLVSSLISVMFGIKPNFHGVNGFKNNSYYYGDMPKGVFGTCTNVIGVHETQARGTLHLHCIIFGGLPPELLKKCSHVPSIHEAIQTVLDSHFSAAVPKAVHARQIVENVMKKDEKWRSRVLNQKIPPMFTTCPSPLTNQTEFFNRLYDNCLSYQFHVHSFTCHKGNQGTHYCRLNFLRAVCDKTYCVQLLDEYDNLNVPVVKKELTKGMQTFIHPNCPIPVPSKRLLVWELKRPKIEPMKIFPCELMDVPNLVLGDTEDQSVLNETEVLEEIKKTLDDQYSEVIQEFLNGLSSENVIKLYQMMEKELPMSNGRIVEHSSTIMNVTCCNQAAIHLGSEDQSYASLFYLSDYFEKNKVQMEHMLSSIERARVHSNQYTSIASDKGTTKRDSQQLITALVNKLDGGAEFSDVQMVAALFGDKAEVATDKFGYFGPHEAYQYAINQQKKQDEKESTKLGKRKRSIEESDDESFSHTESESINNKDPESDDDKDENDSFIDIDIDDDDDDTNSVNSQISFSSVPLPVFEDEDEESESEESVCVCHHSNSVNESDSPGPNVSQAPADYEEICLNQESTISSDEMNEDLGRHIFWKIKTSYECEDEFGNATLQEDQETSILVNVNDHWQFRGKALRFFTREEYNAIIDIKPIPKTHAEKFKDNGETPPGCFGFADGHPLAETHWQQLRRRHQILIYTGKEPLFPGPMPEKQKEIEIWKKKADAFARYYLTTYRMEPDNYDGNTKTSYKYDFEALCDYMNQLKYDSSSRSKLLWFAIQRSITSFKTSNNKKDRLNKYRGRNRTKWSDREKDLYRKWYDQQQILEKAKDANIDFFDNERNETREFENCEYLRNQKLSMDDVFGQCVSSDDQTNHNKPNNSHSRMPVISKSHKEINNIFDRMKLGKSEKEYLSSEKRKDSIQYANQIPSYGSLEDYCRENKLSLTSEQKEVIEKTSSHFKAIAKFKSDSRNKDSLYTSRDSPKLLILGGPGCGKTTTMNCLPIEANIQKVGKILRFSYMGITSIHIGGETFSSVFNPNRCSAKRIPEMTTSEMNIFNDRYDWEDVAAIIIDEISTFSPNYLAIIDQRLRERTGNNVPFGGIMMILSGDFVQMKPVQVSNFISSMMRVADGRGKKENSVVATGTVCRRGVDLMMQFKCLQLTKQQRSKDDVHTSMLHRLHQGQSLLQSDLERFKVLSQDDIKDPDWRFAPVIVLTNRERFDICWSQARRYAKEKGLPIIRWKKREIWWKNRPKNWSFVEENDPLFWQFVILGVDSFVLKNLCPQMTQIANGTPCTIHSVFFDNPAANESFRKRYANASGGDIITLSQAPYSVNVIPWPENKLKRDHCKPYSIVKNKVVVPILSKGFRPTLKEKDGYFVPGINGERNSYALVADVIPIEMSFAMTVDKSLGRTMKKVILALESRPNFNICFHREFVALSRVEKNDDMRFLIHQGKDITESLNYLCKLKPSDELVQFLHGYSGQQWSVWNPKLALKKRREMKLEADKRRSLQRKANAKKYGKKSKR